MAGIIDNDRCRLLEVVPHIDAFDIGEGCALSGASQSPQDHLLGHRRPTFSK